MNIQEFYEPVNVFRQPAIHLKKRDETKTNYNFNRTWQNNTKKIDYSGLRKISDDFNDYYTTKKLKSDYWRFDRLLDSESSFPVDISINNKNDRIVLANSNSKKNITLFQLNKENENIEKLTKLQTITIPTTPITQLDFVEFHSDRNDADILLTGHQNGTVNLIKTTKEKSEISKRFNHTNFMKFIDEPDNSNTNIEPFLGKISMPIKQLKMNTNSNNSFISLINESLFIYDFDNNKSPTYLNHIPEINSFNVPSSSFNLTKNLITLNLGNGISFLDVRQAEAPSIYNIGKDITTSEWLDEYTVATGANNTAMIKIFDMRMFQHNNSIDFIEPFSTCTLTQDSHNVNIKSLRYNSYNQNLHCLDGLGNLSDWDLGTQSSSNRILKNGLSVYKGSKQEITEDALECGDVIVRNGDITEIQLWNDCTIGLGLHELGLHRIVNVVESIPTHTAESSRVSSAPEEDTASMCTDVTSVFDANTDDELLDNSTIRPEPISSFKNDGPNNTYTLENLSCQTIVSSTAEI